MLTKTCGNVTPLTHGGAGQPESHREEVNTMAKVSPFHSKLPGTNRYHDDNLCTEGNNIEPQNKVPGTGGHPKCARCKELG